MGRLDGSAAARDSSVIACRGLSRAGLEHANMSASDRLLACHSSVEDTVQARLGAAADGICNQAQVQQALKRDPLLAALAAAEPTLEHAKRRALELEEQLRDAEASGQLAEAQRRLAVAVEDAHTLREDLKTQLTTAADTRTQLERATQAHARAQAQSEALKTQVCALQGQLAAAQHDAQHAHAQSCERDNDLSRARASASSLQEQLDRQRAESQAAAVALQESQLACQDLHTQLQHAHAECQQLRHAANQAGAGASACITELQGSCAHTGAELASCREELATAQATAQAAGTQVTELRELNRGLRADMRDAEALLRRADQDRYAPSLLQSCALRTRFTRTKHGRCDSCFSSIFNPEPAHLPHTNLFCRPAKGDP